MIEKALQEVYTKFKLNFYQTVFNILDGRETNLTTIETFFVEVIYALDMPTVNEVSRFTGISQPNAAYKIANLVKKGYVERVKNEEDKREVHLAVTDKFKKYYGINYSYVDLVTQRMRERFSKEDVEKFEEMMKIVSDELMCEVTDKLMRKPKVGMEKE